MMRRLAWAGLILAACGVGALLPRETLHPAATAPPLPRIGSLSPNFSLTGPSPLQNALRAIGYRDGADMLLEQRFADGVDERLDGFAAELVRDQVKLIVALNPTAVLAAKRATTAIPILFVSISDPIALGLVSSLSHPGGNITGVANMPSDLSMKRLELLKDAMPEVRRVAILARAFGVRSYPSFCVLGPDATLSAVVPTVSRLPIGIPA